MRGEVSSPLATPSEYAHGRQLRRGATRRRRTVTQTAIIIRPIIIQGRFVGTFSYMLEMFSSEKMAFLARGTPRPTDPLLPDGVGQELFLSLLSVFLISTVFKRFCPQTDRHAARSAARISWGRKLRPTDPPRPDPGTPTLLLQLRTPNC